MRLAGNEEFHGQLSDGESTPDSKFDSFMRCYDILCSRGFSQQAAQETAKEPGFARGSLARR